MQTIDNNKTVEQAILHLDDLRREAMLKADENTLNRILANELMYVHSSATVDTKANYLKTLRSGEASYQHLEFRDRQVQVLGDVAILTGIAAMQVAFNNPMTRMPPGMVNIRYTTTWMKRGQTWQLVVFASTPMMGGHPPGGMQHPGMQPPGGQQMPGGQGQQMPGGQPMPGQQMPGQMQGQQMPEQMPGQMPNGYPPQMPQQNIPPFEMQ